MSRPSRHLELCAALVMSLPSLAFGTEQRAAPGTGSCDGERSWVQLSFEGTTTPAQRSAVLRDLSAGLPRMAVCMNDVSVGTPVSTIIVRRQGRTATIEVRDAITDKRLTRDLDLSPLPEDGHALALAVAADELLRASWAELTLKQRREVPSRTTPPPEVDATVQDVLVEERPSARGQHRFGLRGAVERYTTGQMLLGGDAGYGFTFGRWLLDTWLGVRHGIAVDVELGRVEASAWVAGLGLGNEVVSRRSWAMGPLLAVQGGYARFVGRATGDTTSAALGGPLLTPRAGVFVTARGRAWHTRLEAGGGFPVAALRAHAGGEQATGIAGAEVWGTLGAGVVF